MVFGLIAFLNPSVSPGFTNVVVIPNRGSVNLSKFTVWCVRVSQKERHSNKENIKNLSSGPCIICKQRLARLGFGKIAFSNEKGEIEIHKLKDYKKIHVANNHRRFLTGKKINSVKDINASLDFIKLI